MLLSPYVWLSLSVMSFIIGSIGAHWFAISDLVTGAWPWTTNGGYNSGQLFGLILHTYFTPASLICFMVAVPLLSKSPNISMRRVELSIILGTLICGAWLAYKNGANAILDCGVVFCFYKSKHPKSVT